MIFRTVSDVLCIGYTGEAGRRWEAEQVARTLMNQIPPPVPEDDPAVLQLPDTRGKYSVIGHGRRQVRTGSPLAFVWTTEAVPIAEAGPLRDIISGAKPAGNAMRGFWDAKARVPCGDRRLTVARPDFTAQTGMSGYTIHQMGNYDAPQLIGTTRYGLKYSLNLFHGPHIPPNTMPGPDYKGMTDSAVFWVVPLGFGQEMTLRFTLGRDHGVRAWMHGIEIKDGQRVHGHYGSHGVHLMTEVRGEEELQDTICPVFWEASSPEAESAFRRKRIAAVLPWLKRAAVEVEDPDIKSWAASLVAEGE
jgi:hypothetical protein